MVFQRERKIPNDVSAILQNYFGRKIGAYIVYSEDRELAVCLKHRFPMVSRPLMASC